MNRTIPALALLFCASSGVARADIDVTSTECAHSRNLLAPSESLNYRQYAPDRNIDILHLALDVTPDFKQRTIAAKASLQFKPIAKPLQELKLDAVDLSVESVMATEKILGYQVTTKNIVVTFAEPIPPDREATVTIAYHAEPTSGLYFRTREMGYPEGDTHLFTQGEATEARNWYPCFDSPNEKFTSEITCRVPEEMTVLSNGRLVSQATEGRLVAVRWSQDKPHVSYLISLVAGYFKKVEDPHRDIPLAFYTPPSEIDQAPNSFRDTKDMLAFFEREIGVPYPWAKYYQVCVHDFGGGMENTSITTLTVGTLFTTATENIRDSQGLVAHELAHQWFGDLVTCKDWSDIWLNEGFATYYDSLYDEHKNGRESMLYGLYQRARSITGMANDTNAIVRRTYDSPNQMFNYLAYPKGSWVLHMLRSQLGEDLYRRCIRTYLERHRFDNVVTEDLRAVIEEFSGRSYDQFFDQWVYHAHHPELEVSYAWDETTRLAKLSVRQTQALAENVLLFHFPLTVRFKSTSGWVDHQVMVKKTAEDFYFALGQAPKIVRLDPGYTLLAKIKFDLPTEMLYAQLSEPDDAIGRLLAIEQLSAKKDKATVAQLKHILNHDSFYGARLEACGALRAMHTDEALEALLDSTQQSDARVRRQVLADVGAFYRDSACHAATQALETESNPAILSAALRSLGGYARPEVQAALLKFLKAPSYRNELADAAIAAMRLQEDPSYIAPLLETLSRQEAEFTSRGFGQGLATLAYLARNEESKDRVREFLLHRLNHPKPSIQLAAIDALGTLGDPKAIGALEKFVTASKDSPERTGAEKAVADLRAARKPVDDLKNLRQEVLDLRKEDRELRKELDDLKKKIDTTWTKPAESRSKKKPGSAK